MTDALTSPWSDAQLAAIDAQLERMLTGDALRGSPRLQRLLRHVVAATLAGTAHRLKGYTLGVEVFDRGADFDPNVNPIVRIEAGRLRTRLLAHYGGEGARDPMRIDMPKGGYAVRFLQRGRPARQIDPQDGLRMASQRSVEGALPEDLAYGAMVD